MVELYLKVLFEALWALENLQVQSIMAQEKMMDQETLTKFRPFANLFFEEASKLDLPVTCAQAERLKGALGMRCTGKILFELVDGLRSRLSQELGLRRIYYFNESDMKPMAALGSDWKLAFDAFPSAQHEVEDAMWCYAVGRHNACVFQLMRAVEHGMRALAAERGIKLPADRPLEYGTWENVIKAINNALKDPSGIIKWTPGKAKEAALSFYSGAVTDMSAMRDMYRNAVSHARSDYKRFDADSAIFRVRELLTRLSTKIREGNTIQLQQSDWP
jgi:hypothetical protein